MKETKKAKVIQLHEAGKSALEIANTLSMHTNNVYSVLSKYKLEKELSILKNK